MSNLLHDYRIILRHLRALPSGKSSSVAQIVRKQFREGATLTDSNEIKLRVENIRCYVKMIQSVKEVSYLRSLDSGEKLSPRDKIRASAARVGLGVPQFFNEEASGNK